MEATFVSLTGNHPLVHKCLNTSSPTSIDVPLVRHYHDLHNVLFTTPNTSNDKDILHEIDPSSSHFTLQQLDPILPIGIPIQNLITHLDWQLCSLRFRKNIVELIQAGHTQSAKKLIKSVIPEFLNPQHISPFSESVWTQSCNHNAPTLLISDIPINARLDCQSFVELVRLGDHMQTLKFCQVHLSPYLNNFNTPANAKHLVNHVCGLLAYTDPMNCPLAEYMQLVHRYNLARDMNRKLLVYFNPVHNDCLDRVGASILERLVRQVLTVQNVQGVSVDSIRLKLGLD